MLRGQRHLEHIRGLQKHKKDFALAAETSLASLWPPVLSTSLKKKFN